MSVFNSYNRDEIYEEMDGRSRENGGSKVFNVVSKALSVALLLSLGFASGTLYSNSQKKVTIPENNTTSVPTISTSASNNSSTTYTTSHTDVSKVVEKCANSVVEITIETQSKLYGYYTYTAEGNGSGVIISNDGYILTNNHVIENANKIKVTLRDGTEYEAKLIGKDSKTDVAIIKVEATNLTPAVLGNSDSLVVGELAVVIGNPLGRLGGTVTDGIISALEREIKIDDAKRNLIQTNAAINLGNSGGGLFNANGELVGIVVAKSSGISVEGLGFAIPVNDVKGVINDLLENGYASNRAFLGVSVKDVSYTNNNGNDLWFMFMQTINYGAAVSKVFEGTPAEKVGIKENDIIVSIDDNVITSASDVTSRIATYNVGDTVKVGIIRDNKTMTFDVTLAEYKGE